ncbi:hypothetical protein CBR_g3659 [Chara braunii]|uniref:Uncharacterized protein n=1 Tax=Chara braunii TaxID=69332 RepID=A0A388KFX4_CHABU|nr:hypothetical protein CBR_g3659 [Chara braunii]|eukprot:GBG68960.1 hypothetical protein CBR_g3659 [Chara braunii]
MASPALSFLLSSTTGATHFAALAPDGGGLRTPLSARLSPSFWPKFGLNMGCAQRKQVQPVLFGRPCSGNGMGVVTLSNNHSTRGAVACQPCMPGGRHASNRSSSWPRSRRTRLRQASPTVGLRLSRGSFNHSMKAHAAGRETWLSKTSLRRRWRGVVAPDWRGADMSGTKIRCALSSSSEEGSEKEVYDGMYGSWSITETDRREVFLYRSGIVASCLAFTISSSAVLFPDDGTLRSLLDPLYGLGTVGLGLSLLLIHVYVTEIKRFMQILWAVGCVGSLALALNYAVPSGEPLALYILHHPAAVWAVGPLFAALTALVFKEGLCYGKLEAGALVFVVPGFLLGHLAGLDDGVKLVLLGAWVILFNIFAARKFTQPVKDDIGDKSIFIFNALPEDEKEAFLVNLQQQRYEQGRRT